MSSPAKSSPAKSSPAKSSPAKSSASAASPQRQGRLYALGIGPGDPQLITLSARDLLARLPVVVYPAPPLGDSLARRIAAPHLSPHAREIPMPMTLLSSRFPDMPLYRKTAREIERCLKAGQDVGCLCEGDATLYGSFFYLFNCLTDSVAVTVIPGVSAPMAGASALLLPLAQQDDRLAILPASASKARLEESLRHSESAVFVKLATHFAKVRALLQQDKARLAHAFYIEYASFSQQRYTPLADLPQDFKAPYFSMILLCPRVRLGRNRTRGLGREQP